MEINACEQKLMQNLLDFIEYFMHHIEIATFIQMKNYNKYFCLLIYVYIRNPISD